MDMANRIAAQPYHPQCRTPLMAACAAGNLNTARLLLESGANINAQSPLNGTTALIEAASLGDPKIVALLLDKGADPQLKNKNNQTALDVAKQKSNTKAAAILEQKNKEGQ